MPLDAELECYGHAEITGPSLVLCRRWASPPATSRTSRTGSPAHSTSASTRTEKLTAPSFTLMKAGLLIGGSGADAPDSRDATYDHEIAYRDPDGRAETPNARGEALFGARRGLDPRARDPRSAGATVRY